MLLLFERKQYGQCTCDVIVRSVRANINGFAVLGKRLWSGAITWIRGNPQHVGNAATLAVRGNISLAINIVPSETLTEYSAVVRTQ